MTFEPYLTASTIIQLHATFAAIAVLLGPVSLYRRRRDKVHKIIGYVWLTAMTLAATTAFFIHSFPVIGPFSPIHLLAVLTLWSVWTGTRHAIAGRIHAHEATFRNLYWRGLMVAGLFNFLPGRTTNRTLFPDHPEAGFVVLTVGLIAIFLPVIARMVPRVAKPA